ncbi:MAG: hypothetical protein WKF77_21900 [Planctomycetaceae bacterium]
MDQICSGCRGIDRFPRSILNAGVFLFALLVLNAGRTQPSPIGSAALLETSAQRLILTFGGILIAMLSFALAAYVVSRILKSQRLAAEVVFRRQKLQATVVEMQAAVLEQKNADR